MSLWEGVFRCERLGVENCVVWWDAVGATGTWVAATVTLLAVLLPYQANVQKERVRRRLAVVELGASIEDLAMRVGNVASLMEKRIEDKVWFLDIDWQLLRLPPVTNAIEPSRETEDFLYALTVLKLSVEGWNFLMATAQERGGEFHGDGLVEVLQSLQRRFSNVQRALVYAKKRMGKIT